MSNLYIVCFDVCEPKRLRKIANELENFGRRVQCSVFECHLQPEQLKQLQQRLVSYMDASEDHIRFYPLCGKDTQRVLIDGVGSLTANPAFYLS